MNKLAKGLFFTVTLFVWFGVGAIVNSIFGFRIPVPRTTLWLADKNKS